VLAVRSVLVLDHGGCLGHLLPVQILEKNAVEICTMSKRTFLQESIVTGDVLNLL
jgi:hypothetical protein